MSMSDWRIQGAPPACAPHPRVQILSCWHTKRQTRWRPLREILDLPLCINKILSSTDGKIVYIDGKWIGKTQTVEIDVVCESNYKWCTCTSVTLCITHGILCLKKQMSPTVLTLLNFKRILRANNSSKQFTERAWSWFISIKWFLLMLVHCFYYRLHLHIPKNT